MKKLFIAVALMCSIMCLNAQNYTREGKIFKEVKSEKTSVEPLDTGYGWVDKKGNDYMIFINPNTGRCFIIKESKKTGKSYKQYMDSTLCIQICKEMNITYKTK